MGSTRFVRVRSGCSKEDTNNRLELPNKLYDTGLDFFLFHCQTVSYEEGGNDPDSLRPHGELAQPANRFSITTSSLLVRVSRRVVEVAGNGRTS